MIVNPGAFDYEPATSKLKINFVESIAVYCTVRLNEIPRHSIFKKLDTDLLN